MSEIQRLLGKIALTVRNARCGEPYPCKLPAE